MFIGDILLAQGLVTRADIAAALERQKLQGGRLGDNLVALGKLKASDLEAVIHGAPPAPQNIADTGIGLLELLNLMMKAMYSASAETPSKIAGVLKLTHRTTQALIEQAQERKLLSVLGSTAMHSLSELRFALTEKGKQWAQDAMALNQYIGPAPVSLAAYSERIMRQRITNERVDRAAIDRAFENLVVAKDIIRQLGPAINSGRSILLYGPPGNGKTSIAERVNRVFTDMIYIPYCIDVEGQIIKIFDAGFHKPAQRNESPNKGIAVRREEFDQRWVACQRPFVVTGGELTLEMLDLSFNTQSKFYEAPLHVKAFGGTFVIDDFGRQLVSPEALLNRWISPLESRTEGLKLHTGKAFTLPFDELVIFSTNLSPRDLMDPAFLRRIPYKLEVRGPDRQQFREIFRSAAARAGMEVPDAIVDRVIASLIAEPDGLAGFQPKFIIDQVAAICKFEGIPPQFREEFVEMALHNLSVRDGSSESSTEAIAA